jgi:hypothetical protein
MRRRWALLGGAILLGAAGWAAAVGLRQGGTSLPARAESEKPVLMLLTSLPLVFAERFGLEGGGSPALTALQSRYHVVPIAVADAANLKQGRMLFMAHALAQPAEALVDLDRWVRSGGHAVLLADPMLEWESTRPPGDGLRPAPMFPDTGLLGHWGLQLDAPDERGAVERRLGGTAIMADSPGALSGRRCEIGRDGFVAVCRIGKGLATIIADADFLAPEAFAAQPENADALLRELDRTEPK